MTILQVLAILEAATLECRKRDIDTPEVREALGALEPLVQPKWLIPQFRSHVGRDGDGYVDLEGQEQVLRATFPRIRNWVRQLIGQHMDALAREYAATQDPKVKAELERYSIEHAKLNNPWIFVLQ